MTHLFDHPSRVFSAWIGLCFVTFCLLHSIATRPIPVEVEDHRKSFMGDEQAVVAAMQAANRSKTNLWWVGDKRPYLVLDPDRQYHLSEEFLVDRGVTEIETDAGRPIIGMIHNVPGSR